MVQRLDFLRPRFDFLSVFFLPRGFDFFAFFAGRFLAVFFLTAGFSAGSGVVAAIGFGVGAGCGAEPGDGAGCIPPGGGVAGLLGATPNVPVGGPR
ncbi:MAG TPA: hypothetical protein VKT73_10895 [Xanthobacteraceae bacterium]|nr:hypothetical protein [Xanthobacteraceae bacterium]